MPLADSTMVEDWYLCCMQLVPVHRNCMFGLVAYSLILASVQTKTLLNEIFDESDEICIMLSMAGAPCFVLHALYNQGISIDVTELQCLFQRLEQALEQVLAHPWLAGNLS